VFVFWELTSITSYLLIGFEDRKPEAREAALQALLTTGCGALALLGGIVLVGQAAGSYELSVLAANPPESSPALVTGLLLMLLGAFTKSAQVPFHTWLPGAMAAPTPVSAYLHSATMVKAGVYLIARLSPIFAGVGPYRQVVVIVGLATMIVGAYRALRQHDLKLLLAYGTVSQLGFLVVLFGLGTPETTFAGTAMILAHGIFKAALFMVVGVVDKKAGSRDLRRLAGVSAALPAVVAAGALAAASMAGLPRCSGSSPRRPPSRRSSTARSARSASWPSSASWSGRCSPSPTAPASWRGSWGVCAIRRVARSSRPMPSGDPRRSSSPPRSCSPSSASRRACSRCS
jgi:multicomponent Na+:H+ antiporter subunit A